MGKPQQKWGGLGEVLQGNQLIESQMQLKFRSVPPPPSPTPYSLQDEDMFKSAVVRVAVKSPHSFKFHGGVHCVYPP